MMHIDLIEYELADHVDETTLMKVAQQIVNDWMKALPGFVSWGIHRNNDGRGYMDIVVWESAADAQNAEKEMANIPNAADWYGCYKEGSIKAKSLTGIGQFGR